MRHLAGAFVIVILLCSTSIAQHALVVPYVVHGGDWVTGFGVSNLTDAGEGTVHMVLRDDEGAVIFEKDWELGPAHVQSAMLPPGVIASQGSAVFEGDNPFAVTRALVEIMSEDWSLETFWSSTAPMN